MPKRKAVIMFISENESVDELQINNLKIIQKNNGFKFGTDAVLLSDFAKTVPSLKTLDLCTGTGIIPILLSAKTETPHFSAIEIQIEIADMAKRSVEMNGLEKRISVICEDLRNSIKIYGKRQFDLITCNPPYLRAGSAILNINDSKIISRHEVMCTLEDIIQASSKLLSLSGHLVMIHRPSRLSDLIFLMRKYDIEPKRIRFIHNTAKNPPMLFLVDGLYKGKSDVNILPPLILYNEDGTETDELKKIYQRSN